MMEIRWRNSNYLPYYYKINKYRKALETKIEKIKETSSLKEKLSFATDAAEYATYFPSGYYASFKIEEVFLDAAKQLPDVKCKPMKGTILHVLTQAYTTGGHSRVVERWINSSPQEEKHSVILLNQADVEWPSWLKVAANNHNGEFIILEPTDILTRAYKLRQVASQYEKIILHTHMEDGTALIALGVASFTNPVILFNHADHLFWLGVSIADVVADIRHNNISAIYRGASKRAVFLGIPPETTSENLLKIKQCSKLEIRKELNIPQNAFIIVSTASAHKYSRFGRLHVSRLLSNINRRHQNVYTYLIGPDMREDDGWKRVYEQSNHRVIPLGNIYDKTLYYKYLLSADLYFGSFPTGSFTAMMDGVQMGLPCIQLNLIKQQDSTYALDTREMESLCWCYSEREFFHRVNMAMNDKVFYQRLVDDSQRWLKEYADMNGWLERKSHIYELAINHKVHSFKEKVVLNDMFVQNLFFVMPVAKNREYHNHLLRKLSHFWLYVKIW